MAGETGRELFNNRPVYTLSEIGKSLKSVIAKNYPSHYYVKAEIIKLNLYPKTGHCYPELAEKENGLVKAQMRAVIWSTQFRQINEKFERITGEKLKEGLSILCLVTVEYHEQYGLALYIQDIEPSFTLGEMAKNRAETLSRLKKEGLFDANKRQALPLLPKRVAVISVDTSKGYHDFMITLQQNQWNYCFETQLFPAVLQGEKAITTIVAQLSAIEKIKNQFDCVAIVRGGGGDVGLSCYDDYRLAAAVAAFPLPVLSGIGHSTNVTITEMVAFETKITPTEVAYFLIQKFHDFSIQVQDFQDFILQNATQRISENKQWLAKSSQLIQAFSQTIITKQKSRQEGMQRELKIHTARLIERKKEQIVFSQKQLRLLCQQELSKKNDQLTLLCKQIDLLHPKNVLKRGFSITLADGKAVTDVRQLHSGAKITTRFYAGEADSEVTAIRDKKA